MIDPLETVERALKRLEDKEQAEGLNSFDIKSLETLVKLQLLLNGKPDSITESQINEVNLTALEFQNLMDAMINAPHVGQPKTPKLSIVPKEESPTTTTSLTSPEEI
jgi:hypothetical protein